MTTTSSLSKKDYLKIKEVEQLYKMIQKYSLREAAYKKLLQVYIQFQKQQKKEDQNS